MVTTPIRIGITGTHSTGKTVLMQRIEMELCALGVRVARTHGLGKRAAAAGLPKMHHHTATSTEWIITTGIADELAGTVHAEVILADRAPLDALAYYTAALEHRGETGDQATLQRLEQLVATQTTNYEIMLATVLDPAASIQSGHDYDARYRQLVDRHVHARLKQHGTPHHLVSNDDTSREDAIRQVLGCVDRLDDLQHALRHSTADRPAPGAASL